MFDPIVSRRFRDEVLRLYPCLADRPRSLALFGLLCFGTTPDRWFPDANVLSHRAILDAVGLDESTSSRAFQSGKLIERLRADVLPDLHVVPHEFRIRKARIVWNVGFSPAMEVLLRDELLNFHRSTCRVGFVSGERVIASVRPKLIAEDARVRALISKLGAVPPADRILRYMNGVSKRLFEQCVRRNMAAALQVAAGLPQDRALRALRILRAIQLQPKPFYGPSKVGRTLRVSALGQCIQRLPNEVKRPLLDGWTHFDLRSAQLAIVARDWQLDDLCAWLAQPKNHIWSELCGLFPSHAPASAKPIFKEGVYAICYGASRRRIIATLRSGLGIDGAGASAFLGHWIVRGILERRREILRGLAAGHEFADAFGRKLVATDAKTARSALAQHSQSQEMQLLLPVFTLAERTNDFRIVLWEHDGFSVHFYRRAESNIERILEAVNRECRRLGYPTELVAKR